jgi:hypothetical protein
MTQTAILVCAECGRESDDRALGWRALVLSGDDEHPLQDDFAAALRGVLGTGVQRAGRLSVRPPRPGVEKTNSGGLRADNVPRNVVRPVFEFWLWHRSRIELFKDVHRLPVGLRCALDRRKHEYRDRHVRLATLDVLDRPGCCTVVPLDTPKVLPFERQCEGKAYRSPVPNEQVDVMRLDASLYLAIPLHVACVASMADVGESGDDLVLGARCEPPSVVVS